MNPTSLGTPEDVNLPRVSLNATTILAITNFVTFIAGALAVIFIIISGIQYVTSAGSPQKAAKARLTLLYAVLGLIIAVLARTLINFVIKVG